MEKEIGIGVGGGVLGALLSFFGLRERVKRLEKESISRGECETCRQGSDNWRGMIIERLDRIEKKQDIQGDLLHEMIGALKKK